MKKLIAILGAAVMLANVAKAESNEGVYVSATGSMTFHNDVAFKNKTNGEITTNQFKLGGGSSIAVGYVVDQWRVELEGLYRKSDLEKMTFTNTADNLKAKGVIRDTAIMTNVYYDIPLECNFGLYVGAGAGIDFKKRTITETTLVAAPNTVDSTKYSKSSKHFAWQLMAGANYDITENVTAFAGYRLFATTKVSSFGNTPVKSKSMPMTHSVDVGIRYRF